MKRDHLHNYTQHQDINNLITKFSARLQEILGNQLIGIYLTGSLSYGDFNQGSSDIDIVAVISSAVTPKSLELIKALHNEIAKEFPRWADRFECSYLPQEMLNHVFPPKEARPYYGGGLFYEEADYGNEWIINNYLLYQHSVALFGKNFSELAKPIDIIEVQKACVRDLFKEWEPKINDYMWLENSHYQSYIVMNLCRILYTVICGKTGSKRESAEWIKNKFGSQWRFLIETAENWEYGKAMSLPNEASAFIRFAINQIESTAIYQQMYPIDSWAG